MGKVRVQQNKPLSLIAKSQELGDVLERLARPVYDACMEDPNQWYRDTLRLKRFVSGGKRGRISVQVGVNPLIGARVEAKRGTLSRAVARAGL